MKPYASVISAIITLWCIGIIGCKHSDKNPAQKEDFKSPVYDLDQVYLNNIKKEESKHRSRVADYIRSHADRIEIFLLKNAIVEPESDGLDSFYDDESSPNTKDFEIVPYGHSVQVVSTIFLDKDLKEASNLIADVILSANDGSPFSHKPSYGIRVYSGGKKIFSTSISKDTNNFYFLHPTEGGVSPEWFGVGDLELKKFVDFVDAHLKR